jgi:hypothetical protein
VQPAAPLASLKTHSHMMSAASAADGAEAEGAASAADGAEAEGVVCRTALRTTVKSIDAVLSSSPSSCSSSSPSSSSSALSWSIVTEGRAARRDPSEYCVLRRIKQGSTGSTGSNMVAPYATFHVDKCCSSNCS